MVSSIVRTVSICQTEQNRTALPLGVVMGAFDLVDDAVGVRRCAGHLEGQVLSSQIGFERLRTIGSISEIQEEPGFRGAAPVRQVQRYPASFSTAMIARSAFGTVTGDLADW